MSRPTGKYRRIITSIHEDEWFRSLTPGARNLYLNLIPFVGISGAQNASVEKLARLAGYGNAMMPMFVAKIIVKKHLKALREKVMYWDDDEVIWIKNFSRYQGAGVKYFVGVEKHAKNFRSEIANVITNHILSEETVENAEKTAESIGYQIPYEGEKHTVSDTVSDTKPRGGVITGARAAPIAGRGTEYQSSRVSEKQSITSIHQTESLRVRAREMAVEYLKHCPSGLLLNPDGCNKVLLEKIDKALQAHDLDWWIKMFEKAEASDYLSGKVPGGDGNYFKIKFGWIIKMSSAKKINDGDYDNYETSPGRVNRNPDADWQEVAHA